MRRFFIKETKGRLFYRPSVAREGAARYNKARKGAADARKEAEDMYELDKAAFGRFLAQLRREKGMTQKELAATLYVSDKAVSKWERGVSHS